MMNSNVKRGKRNNRLSVLMPVFNCERYVVDAMESILNQTLKDYEFIIVNDGSTDRTPEIINEYGRKDSRIKVIHQQNAGIVSALNRGLSEARGEWVFRMDGDDIALSQRFEQQWERVRNDQNLVLLGGWCQQIDAEGSILKRNSYPAEHHALVSALEKLAPFFPHPTACFHRETVIRLGGYRERFRHAEDYDLWLRLSRVGKLGCCKKVLLNLRKHSQNVSNSDTGYGNVQQVIAVAAAIGHFNRKAGRSDPSFLKDDQWKDFLCWIKNRMNEKHYFERMTNWEMLRNAWFHNRHMATSRRSLRVLQEIFKNRALRGALWWKYRKNIFVSDLAFESMKFFSKAEYQNDGVEH